MKKYIYDLSMFVAFMFLLAYCVDYYVKSVEFNFLFVWVPDINPMHIGIMIVVSFFYLFAYRKDLRDDELPEIEGNIYGQQQIYLSPREKVKLYLFLILFFCLALYSIKDFFWGEGSVIEKPIFLLIAVFLIIKNTSDFVLFCYEKDHEMIKIVKPETKRKRNKEYAYGLFPDSHEPGIPFEGKEKEQNENKFKKRISV